MYSSKSVYLFPPVHIFRKLGLRAFDVFCASVLRRPARRPWMLAEEVDIIRDLLLALKPMRCLEWGAGYSTIFFPRFLSPGAEWLAVEHVDNWAFEIRKHVASKNVKVFHIPPTPMPGPRFEGDGTYQQFRDYIEFPSQFGTYDFILIDGRARKECLLKAEQLLACGGLVVLHDANRSEYQPGTLGYPHQFAFMGRGKEQLGLWLGSRNIKIEAVLDLSAHNRTWSLYEKLGRILRR